MTMQSLGIIAYTLKYQPLYSKLSNVLEVFNEICILFLSYSFNDRYVFERFYGLVHSLLPIIALNLLVNMTVMIVLTVQQIVKSCKQIISKLKAYIEIRKKAQKYQLRSDELQNDTQGSFLATKNLSKQESDSDLFKF